MFNLFTDSGLYSTECQLIALFAGGFLVAWVVTTISGSRPGLTIGRAVAAAFFLRIVAATARPMVSPGREPLIVVTTQATKNPPANKAISWHSVE